MILKKRTKKQDNKDKEKNNIKTFNDFMTAWFVTFTATTRREVAKILLAEYEEEVEG